jgi:hypothetical protein
MASDRIEQNPAHITSAEIAVGIPSYKEAESIRFPTLAADKGLLEFFPDRKSVIINCDNSSPDGTREAFLNLPGEIPKISLSTPKGVKGKGHNLFNLFRRSLELGAETIVVLDADVRSVAPVWIRNLAEPLLKGFEFVTPLYVRHPYEGTISSNIIHPMTRCLYGKRVREPIGGDFGVSAQLARILVEEPQEGYVTGFGIDVLMTTVAISQGMSICQSFLGRPKSHKRTEPETGILPVFVDNVRTLFSLMEQFYEVWKTAKWSKPTAVFGTDLEVESRPEPLKIDLEAFHGKFIEGFSLFGSLWKKILHQDVFTKLQEVREFPMEGFDFPTLLWALILFDYALAHKKGEINPSELIESLMPVYLGRTCSTSLTTAHMSTQQVEVYIDDQCRVFEEIKPYLLQQWERT